MRRQQFPASTGELNEQMDFKQISGLGPDHTGLGLGFVPD
jgi:hypothetical protein